MARTALVSLTALAVTAGIASSAAAQSCGMEIERLAQQYNLSTEAPSAGTTEPPSSPAAPPSTAGSTTTEKLAQSGGVLTPPDTGAPMAIHPPQSNPDNMPTAPPVKPAPQTQNETGSAGLTAADRARMESLLQAGRAAERQGKEQQCLERLREAAAIPHAPSAR
jgi:hypothetical protein